LIPEGGKPVGYKAETFCAEWQNVLCTPQHNCSKCGWNPREHAARIAAIRKREMQTDEDGLKRLHISKEDIETEAD
jgi:hypothetical protein